MLPREERPDCAQALRGVQDFTVDTAEELLDALSPRSELWEGESSAWIFRGQAEAAWALQPKSSRDLRLFGKFGVALHPSMHGQSEWSKSAALVNDMLKIFRRGLNRAGIAIPALEPNITTGESGRVRSMNLPEPEAFPLMALAQHHGLPTPMLDWSRCGLVAAYFASSDAAARLLRSEQSGSHLSIWALQRRATDPVDFRFEVLLTEAPGAGNPNLNAQAGLFTVSLDEDARPLDLVLQGRAAFRRIHAPASESAKLLRLLADEGVTGASMFPGADGVVLGMKESTLWDVPPAPLPIPV